MLVIRHKYLISPNDAYDRAVTKPTITWNEITELQSEQRTTEWRNIRFSMAATSKERCASMCLVTKGETSGRDRKSQTHVLFN